MNIDENTGNNLQENIRMSGFLEKKGKMKLMSQWKKYWFILEERLLLYYRSEIEYTNLSPCRGSLNMGLVTTVRPGSSTGPCVIHIITRSQVIQLRAKNRATQEKWLKALLHSMSLPLVNFKALKPSAKRPYLVECSGSSLDNIALKGALHTEELENECTSTHQQDFNKGGFQISGTLYGGSLDTAHWYRKFKSGRSQSPNTSKAKFLEKILGFTRENDSLTAVAVRSRHSWLSLDEGKEMKFVGKDNSDVDDEVSVKNVKCKIHNENRANDIYSTVDKRKKKMSRTLSDTELNKIQNSYPSLENVKTERKDESTFERIKNVLSRIPKENILKGKAISEKRSRPPKKRRQSFLQKVFKKKECETPDFESDSSDPLYDTIEHLQEQTRSSIPAIFTDGDIPPMEKEHQQGNVTRVESLYAEVQKPVVGSKSILSAKTMCELKLKLKSRENLDEEIRTGNKAPSLPPRRVSRPISPWHDVPTNNAPVGGDARSFFVHQAVVKFNDNVPPIEIPKGESDYSDIETDLRLDPRKGSLDYSAQEKKNDDLSILLEQLTKITVAPLAEPELTDDNYNSSSESEKFWSKSRLSEPDYDIPRSHKPLNILISEGKEIISSTEFMGKSDNYSDTGSSVKSIEPDSLEMADKNLNVTS